MEESLRSLTSGISSIVKKVPPLPFSALIFYLGIVCLWKAGFIPNPAGVFDFLEGLYKSYGLQGLFVASFLEGIVYLGLYFPGSFVVALAVILSQGTFWDLLSISLTVATALSITSIINYAAGRKLMARRLSKELILEEKRVLSKGLFLSMLHPNALAFYFFNAGIKKHNFLKLLLVPVILIPYGLLLGAFLFSIKGPLKQAIESPYLMISYLLVWMLLASLIGMRKKT